MLFGSYSEAIASPYILNKTCGKHDCDKTQVKILREIGLHDHVIRSNFL